MALTEEQLELLRKLDDHEWRTVGYRLGNFYPWMADELVREGLAESRQRKRKRGAHVYRRTVAGCAMLDAQKRN
jgi:hypothetical protein